MLPVLLAMTIAFPGAGQKLPPVKRAYMIGAAPQGVTNVTVQGRAVDVYRTGAWATMVDVVEGTNTIAVTAGSETSNHVFRVQKFPLPAPATTPPKPPAPPKVWEKLEYCGDEPKPHPNGKAKGEIAIVIDPGHGGSDTGAVSPHGLFEKNANLLLSKALANELRQRGYRVLMTREEDVALVLTERPRLAHKENADLFVSIHHNAPAADKDAAKSRYTSVYSWNPLGEALSRRIASRIAAATEGEMPSKGSLHANFAVTRNPEIPSCLVEADFITSPEGEEAIFNNERRGVLARAIADGIEDWLADDGGEQK